jgi:hypothetical protein
VVPIERARHAFGRTAAVSRAYVKPQRAYASANTSQRTSHREQTATAECARGADSVLLGARSSSKACWPGVQTLPPGRHPDGRPSLVGGPSLDAQGSARP